MKKVVETLSKSGEMIPQDWKRWGENLVRYTLPLFSGVLFAQLAQGVPFKVAFSKLIQDQHPDNDSFWPHGRSNSDPLKELDNNNDFWRAASIANQLKLASIVAGAKISDIQVRLSSPQRLISGPLFPLNPGL